MNVGEPPFRTIDARLSRSITQQNGRFLSLPTTVLALPVLATFAAGFYCSLFTRSHFSLPHGYSRYLTAAAVQLAAAHSTLSPDRPRTPTLTRQHLEFYYELQNSAEEPAPAILHLVSMS